MVSIPWLNSFQAWSASELTTSPTPTATTIPVNGQSSRYNNYEIDGQSNNDNSVGGTLVFFGSQDAIQQLQIITNQYSAQYGRNAGAVVNYITKSGSNAFHGSAFDLYQGQFLSSLSNTEKNPLLGYLSSWR